MDEAVHELHCRGMAASNVIEPIAERIEAMATAQTADASSSAGVTIEHEFALGPTHSDQHNNLRRVIEPITRDERCLSSKDEKMTRLCHTQPAIHQRGRAPPR